MKPCKAKVNRPVSYIFSRMEHPSLKPLKIEFHNKVHTVTYNPHATIRQTIMNVGVTLSKDPHSIRLLYQPPDQQAPIALIKEGNTLQDYSIPEGATLRVKDLGPQIGYRTVFLAEYLGPLTIWWIVYVFSKPIYSFYNNYYDPSTPRLPTQSLATLLWTVHYGKRLLESVFVHKFSHATMPLFNLFKNCIYYWGFAFLIAYICLHPDYTPPPFMFQVIGTCIFCVCETCNFMFVFLLSHSFSSHSSFIQVP